MTFSTRVTTTDESAIIHEVIATAGWGITHECVHVVQSLDPAAYLLASDESGRAIGVGFGLAFRQSAWIGHLVVRPEARGLGVGKALFDEILRHLVDSGKWPIYLVATEMGAPLYAKFGFVHDGGWTRWEFPHGAEPNLAAVAALGASSLGISVLPIEDGHLSRLVQFDTERFGDDRGQLLELSYRMYPSGRWWPSAQTETWPAAWSAARWAWGPSWRSPKPRRRSWRACCACLRRRGRPGST